jgi:hypothetical protein
VTPPKRRKQAKRYDYVKAVDRLTGCAHPPGWKMMSDGEMYGPVKKLLRKLVREAVYLGIEADRAGGEDTDVSMKRIAKELVP